jgi:hypothetical protein
MTDPMRQIELIAQWHDLGPDNLRQMLSQQEEWKAILTKIGIEDEHIRQLWSDAQGFLERWLSDSWPSLPEDTRKFLIVDHVTGILRGMGAERTYDNREV